MRGLPLKGRVSARILAAFALCAFMLTVALAPSAGFAGSIVAPIPLAIGVSTPGTLSVVAGAGAGITDYSLRLDAGQTLAATYTPSPAIAEPAMVVFPPDGHEPELWWVARNLDGRHPMWPTTLFYVAPWTGTYTIRVAGPSAGATYTLDTAIVPRLTYTLSPISAPSWMGKNHWFKVSTVLSGTFADVMNPVRFFVQRKVGRWWRTYRMIEPAFDSQRAEYATSTPFWTSLKLPKGTFRVRAAFADPAHMRPQFDDWKTIAVDIPVPRATAAELVRPSSAATVSALATDDLVLGYGAAVKKGSKVSVDYIGWLTSGKQIDSTIGRPAFSANIGRGQLIEGWDRGLIGMKPGGIRQLIIPASMAYGAQGASPLIPPNATLWFTVKLLSVK